MEFWIYLIGIIENVTKLLGVITFISALYIIASIIYILIEGYDPSNPSKYEEIKKKLKRWQKIVIPILVFCSLLLTFIPSKETIVAMYVIPKVVGNEEVQKLPENVLKFMNEYLEKKTEELQK